MFEAQIETAQTLLKKIESCLDADDPLSLPAINKITSAEFGSWIESCDRLIAELHGKNGPEHAKWLEIRRQYTHYIQSNRFDLRKAFENDLVFVRSALIILQESETAYKHRESSTPATLQNFFIEKCIRSPKGQVVLWISLVVMGLYFLYKEILRRHGG